MMLRIALLVLSVHLCTAYPSFYIHAPNTSPEYVNLVQPKTTPGCLDHPTQGYGPHPAPVVDTSTKVQFTVQGRSTNAADTICLGRSYNVQVTFPEARFALLTASAGILQPSNAFFDDARCAGKRYMPSRPKPTTFTTVLFVPCNTTATSLTIKITSTGEEDEAFKSWSKAYNIGTCGVAQCENVLPIYPPPPPPMASPPPSAQQSGQCAPKQFTSTNCTASSMGYSCSLGVDKGGTAATIHYSLGGCAPANECTKAAFFPAAVDSKTTILHIAAESQTDGYVAVGFATETGNMANMDAVLGYMGSTGTGSINMHPVDSKLQLGTPYNKSALSYAGVLKTNGKTIICFGRPLTVADTDAKYSAILAPSELKLNWAVSSSPSLGPHKAAAGVNVNLASGAVNTVSSAKEDYVLAHGALMAAAWCLLFPTGILMARHKWVLAEKKLAGIHMWFQLHRIIQITGFFAMLAAFVIALIKLDAGESKVGELHEFIGIVVFALTGAQILGTLPRPKPDTPTRYLWNQLHHWAGRLITLGGIATVFIGIVLLHDKSGGFYKYTPWLIPTIAALALMLVADVVLTVMRARYGHETESVEKAPNGAVGYNTEVPRQDPGKYGSV